MVHQRQRLTLRLESEDRFAPDEPRFQQFQRDATPYRFGLLGEPDFAHPAFRNPMQELVTINDDRRGVCRISRDRWSEAGIVRRWRRVWPGEIGWHW